MLAIATWVALFTTFGQADAKAGELADRALKTARSEAESWTLRMEEGSSKKCEFRSEPLLKYSNDVAGKLYGSLFIWTFEEQPVAACAAFRYLEPFNHVGVEFHILSDQRILGDRSGATWRPEDVLKRMPIDGAPAPAASAVARSSQMRTLAKEFTVDVTHRDTKAKSNLRLLTQPLYRYANPKANVVDGGLFTYVTGTDPEALLLLEARTDGEKPAWHFAFARMTHTLLEANRRGVSVWRSEIVPWPTAFDSKRGYWLHTRPPVQGE
jgi:hypothetical protein